MLELAAVLVLVVLVALQIVVHLVSLPSGATIAVGLVAVPLLAWLELRRLLCRHQLGFLTLRRRPLPPELFYWNRTRRELLAEWRRFSLLAPASWLLVLAFPAGLSLGLEVLAGWVIGLVAVIAGARLTCLSWVYLEASQRISPSMPHLFGWLRKVLYRLSNNPEFLGEERANQQDQAQMESKLPSEKVL